MAATEASLTRAQKGCRDGISLSAFRRVFRKSHTRHTRFESGVERIIDACVQMAGITLHSVSEETRVSNAIWEEWASNVVNMFVFIERAMREM